MTTPVLSKYALLEVENFATDEADRPLTSYLRLGAVAQPELVASAAAMAACRRDLGATTARTGAGEDLAARVTGFVDDTRDCCDPPSLDASVPAEATVAGASELPLEVLQKSLETERKRHGALDRVLTSVTSDAQAWLDAMYAQWTTEAAEVTRLQSEFDAALAQASSAAPSDADAFVPPSYSAPGHEAGAQPGSYAAYAAETDRQRKSARLHTLGGVRDHTDGNRITTTRGDKLEIVQGNYRLVVLGRHDQPVDPNSNAVLPGWDISGGHMSESEVSSVAPPVANPKVGLAPSVGKFWKQRWNGNWQDIEETVKGDTKTVISGDTHSQSYGHYIKNFIGSENAPAWHEPKDCPGGACRTNPKIISQTWAEHVKSSMGSKAEPVKLMTDTTHVKTMVTKTNATTQTDRVTAQDMTSTTTVGSMTTTTTGGTINSSTTATSVTDKTESGLITTINITALKADSDYGSSSSTTIGLTNDIFLGAKASAKLAASFSLSAALSGSIFVGIKMSTSMGAIGSTNLFDGKKIGLCPTIELNTGATTELSLLIKTTSAHVELG